MIRFPGPTLISGMSIGEFRMSEIGSSPRVMAKFAYMTNSGHSVGQFIMLSISPESHRLLQAAYESMEADAISMIMTGQLGNYGPPNTSDPRDDRDASDDPAYFDEDAGLEFP